MGWQYRKREHSFSKDPEKRQKQLDNLKARWRTDIKERPLSVRRYSFPNEEVWLAPVSSAKELLGATLHVKQQELLQAIAHNPLLAARSANACGKTYVLAIAVLLWLLSYPDAIVVTTSSSQRQLKLLWREIHRFFKRSDLKRLLAGAVLNQLELRIDEDRFATGVSANIPENLGGFHSGHVLTIADEASALEEAHSEALLSNGAGPQDRVVFSGNPLRSSGPFFDCFRMNDWHTFHMNVFNLPGVADEEKPIPGLASRLWLERRKAAWGEDSPAYKARCLGEFPDEGEDTLILLSWIEAACERENPRSGAISMGVDVARFGSDRTVFVIRDEKSLLHLESTAKQSTMETCGKIIALKRQWVAEKVFVDDAGLGGGVTDRLKELQEKGILPINFARSAKDSAQFLNCRAESYWQLRVSLQADFSIPQRYALPLQELASIKYTYASNGKLKLEAKDEIKKRLGRSPDFADALALSFAGKAAPKASQPRIELWG